MITCWTSDLQRLEPTTSTNTLVAWVKHAEKRIFPRIEALDFDSELQKHNTELMIVLDETLLPHSSALVAYSVYARHQKTVLLHKLCVLERYRRQGVARRILKMQIEKSVGCRGCDSVRLWVDEKRMPAVGLYAGLGFKEVDRVQDYYAPGRTGVRMLLPL
ncbi:hypothetical protein MMC29_007098 [Sticta canariensis]|nr:hypothetical protein [Sticta canariensis]